MIDERSNTNVHGQFVITTYNNGNKNHSRTDNYGPRSHTTRQLQKSELVVNEPVNGWRKPSPYKLKVREYDPGYVFATDIFELVQWNGNVYIEERSFGGTPGWKSQSTFRPPFDTGVLDAMFQNERSVFMEHESIRAARNSVAGRAFDLSASLLEVRSSLEGLSSLAKRISDSYVGIRTRNAKRVFKALGNPRGRQREYKALKNALTRSAVNTPKGFAEALLTVEWGLKPLIDDMIGVCAFLSEDGRFFFVNGTGHSGEKQEKVAEVIHGVPSMGTIRDKIQYSNKHGYRTSLWFELETRDLRKFTKFGLTDLPSALWAVMPWSFMVDWVIPVSSYLKSLTATYGLRYKGGTTTYYSEKSAKSAGHDYTVTPSSNDGFRNAGFDYSGPKAKVFEMDRYVHPREPVGFIPTIRDPFGAYQAVMSLALLGARLPSIKVK